MPTISVYEEELFEKIGKSYSEDELNEICFNFGLEIDDVEYKNEKKIYKIEVPANRYDLICVEGIGRALKNFVGNYEKVEYNLINYDQESCIKENHVIHVEESVDEKRPYVVGCILKDIVITESVYNNIIDIQEKLHHNIGKKRTILAIGVHDYDKIQFPVRYKFMDKASIEFIPLNETNSLNGSNLISFYEKNMHLKPYLKIIQNYDKYPVIMDSESKILSVPPIINCDHTKITLETKNIFFECTAIDKNAAEIALNILCYMLSEYCTSKYSIHSTLVQYDSKNSVEAGKSYLYPLFRKKLITLDLSYARISSGISELTPEMAEDLLKKMMLYVYKEKESRITDPLYNTLSDTITNTFSTFIGTSSKSAKTNESTEEGKQLIIQVPFFRSDIMHSCDIVEDLSIAYGYMNIVPSSFYCATRSDLHEFSDLFRSVLVESGYNEIITNTLLSMKDNYQNMYRSHQSYDESINIDAYNPLAPPVQIMNSKTAEYEIVRTSLIVNIIKFAHANKHKELPIRFFEIGDVCYVCKGKTDTNAINKRHISLLFGDKNTAGLEEIHGMLETVLAQFQLYSNYKIEEKKKEGIQIRSDVYYELIPKEDPSFLNERVVDIVLFPHNLKFGVMGIVHPKVLQNFEMDIPISVLEINIESLYNRI